MYEAALAFSTFCWVVVSLHFLRSPAFSFFHPLSIYSLFHGLLFVVRPIFARVLDYEYIYRAYRFNPSPSDKLTVILAANLGFLTFAFFSVRSGSVPMQFKLDRFTSIERARLKLLLPWLLAIFLPLGIYSLRDLWLGIDSGAGYSGVVLDRSTGISIHAEGSGYLQEFQLTLATCGAIIAWIFRFRLIALLPLLIFVVFRAGTGGRGPFVAALLATGLLYLYEHRRKFASMRVMGLLVATVALFYMIGGDRGESLRGAIRGNSVGVARDSYAGLKPLEGMDLGNLEYFEYIVYAVPQRTGTYDYFLENLQLFTEPIPRNLWRDKPIGAPIKRFNLFDYGYPIGMTRSLPGQGWFFLGWLGVVIWCGMWGYALGWIYRKFVEGPQNSLQTLSYLVFLPILVVAFRDGTIVTVFREALFFFAPIVIWYGLSRLFSVPTAQQLRLAAFRRWRRLRMAGKFGAPPQGGGDEPLGERRRLTGPGRPDLTNRLSGAAGT